MKHEMIVRLVDGVDDVEILFNNLFTKEKIEKKLTLSGFTKVLVGILESDQEHKSMIKCFKIQPNVVGFGQYKDRSRVIIQQPEHKRFVTVSIGEVNKSFYINFPSSIYSITTTEVGSNSKINNIECYMYLDFDGDETKLYQYAMPNMLSENRFCIGQAPKEIHDNDVIQALERIIYAPYSHAQLNNIKGFQATLTYFEYLESSSVQAKHLYTTDKKLKDLY